MHILMSFLNQSISLSLPLSPSLTLSLSYIFMYLCICNLYVYNMNLKSLLENIRKYLVEQENHLKAQSHLKR